MAPPDTKSLTVSALSTTPAQLELQGSAAGFDLFGDLTDAENGDLLSVASVDENGHPGFIARGIWFTNMQQIGPFTDDGPPAGSTTLSASMETYAFDDASPRAPTTRTAGRSTRRTTGSGTRSGSCRTRRRRSL